MVDMLRLHRVSVGVQTLADPTMFFLQTIPDMYALWIIRSVSKGSDGVNGLQRQLIVVRFSCSID